MPRFLNNHLEDNKIVLYLKMIKFSHSVFALPFAFSGAIFAAAGIPTFEKILWITIAMVSARSGAMGLNRLIDSKIDALNPRTATREIPTGKIRPYHALVFTIISFATMVLSAYMLNPLCFKLSPIAIAIFTLYSYTKRFTWLSHIVLGIAISGAPLGAWIAITGDLDLRILPLCLAVIFWLAGFDILYALQDIEFDRNNKLYSIPVRFGIKKSLVLSRVFHLLTWLLLVYTGLMFNLSLFYWVAVAIIMLLLIYEHGIVRENDLSKLNIAFFNMNGYISVLYFLGVLLSIVFQ